MEIHHRKRCMLGRIQRNNRPFRKNNLTKSYRQIVFNPRRARDLYEIEAALNSLPISIDSDSTENFPLTPSHFLLGRRLTSLPAGKLSTVDGVVDKRVLKRFNYRERLLNNFWRQWRKDYLLNLKSAHFVNPKKRLNSKLMILY
ncbi:DUF5641 domain-containing protein [Trichonephila clavipes]|nr:DUF5641 domain-containing protein [Trichonephila clavipes]